MAEGRGVIGARRPAIVPPPIRADNDAVIIGSLTGVKNIGSRKRPRKAST
jgi:hypothetical protein